MGTPARCHWKWVSPSPANMSAPSCDSFVSSSSLLDSARSQTFVLKGHSLFTCVPSIRHERTRLIRETGHAYPPPPPPRPRAWYPSVGFSHVRAVTAPLEPSSAVNVSRLRRIDRRSLCHIS